MSKFYCAKCNLELENDGRFCQYCGQAMVSEISYYGLLYAKGNTEMFSKLYESTIRGVTIEARNRVPENDVDDCIQNIYIKMVKNIGSFDENKASFSTWFQKLRSNEITTFNEKLKSHNNNIEQDYNELEMFIKLDEGYTNDVEATFEQKECKELVLEMLEKMPDAQRKCIIKYFFEGVKQKDIAEQLAIPVGTVKSRLSQGKDLLKNIVLDYENRGIVVRGATAITVFTLLWEKGEVHASELKEFGVFTDELMPEMSEQLLDISKGYQPVDVKIGTDTNTQSVITESAKIATKTGTKIGLTKVIATTAVVATLGVAGVVGVNQFTGSENSSELKNELEITESIEEEPLGYAAPEFEIYEEVIQAYYELFDGKDPYDQSAKINQIMFPDGREDEYDYSGMTGFSNPPQGSMIVKGEPYEDLYFGLYDIDGDGNKELFISVDPSNYTETSNLPAIDIWSIKGGRPNFLISQQYRNSLVICEGNLLRTYGSGGAYMGGYYFNQILDGELQPVYVAEYDWFDLEETDLKYVDVAEYTYGDTKSIEEYTVSLEEFEYKLTENPVYVAPIEWFTNVLPSDDKAESNKEENTEIIQQYNKIIEVYYELFVNSDAEMDTIEIQSLLRETFSEYNADEMLGVDVKKWDELYYGFYDLNGDNEPELIISRANPNGMSKEYEDYAIESIWSVHNNEVYYVADRAWGQVVIEKDGTVSVIFGDVYMESITLQMNIGEDGKYKKEILEYTYEAEYFDFMQAEWNEYKGN